MTWQKAFVIGDGGTRAERNPEERKAWANRVRRIEARARVAMKSHGATDEDLCRDEYGTLARRRGWDTLCQAAKAFFETLTPEQREAVMNSSNCGAGTWDGVLGLFESCHARPDDRVLCYDEYVPIAESVWPGGR